MKYIKLCFMLLFLTVFLSACSNSENQTSLHEEKINTNKSSVVDSKTTVESAPPVTPEEKKEAEEQWKKAVKRHPNGLKNDKPISFL